MPLRGAPKVERRAKAKGKACGQDPVPPGETAVRRSTPNCPTHTSDAPQPSAEPMPGAHAPADTSCTSQSQEAALERETSCEMYGCSKDVLMCTACCRRRLCPECTLRCSHRRLDPTELRNFCARFTQSGADVSATAAVADFKCPFCRSVGPLSEREVCMQSMMIAIGPLFRANGPQAAVGGPDQPG